MFKISRVLFGILPILLLPACVTVNITFPPAAAQQAADQIIDQVWQQEGQTENPPEGEAQEAQEQPEPAAPAESDEQSSLSTFPRWFAHGLDLLVPAAHAAPKINISTPAIKAIKDRMADRHKEIEPYYNNGAIGLTNDALITTRNINLVPLRKRNKVKQQIAAENRDRLDLYDEIAKANGRPEWKDKIRATFAERWIKKAKKGWWYQDEKGRWQQK